jgi:ribonucleoside-diphosphate reductase alpha chain
VEDGKFNYDELKADIPHVVRAVDNVIDRTSYPLPQQELEAKTKRRMGLGITGLASALLMMGIRYGSPAAVKFVRKVMRTLTYTAYEASSDLALEKGSFPAYKEAEYLSGAFIARLPEDIRLKIETQGMRNSHLISIAPTGTISFTADNISSGIEPVFLTEVQRTVLTEEGSKEVILQDYAYHYFGLKGATSDELSVDEHLDMQIAVQPYVDSAVSKTINVGADVSFDDFKDVYVKAWKGKLKGITTYRAAGSRTGILKEVTPEPEGAACFIDPDTGNKTCDE